MRRHDWAERMYQVIEDHKAIPFEWGVNDCSRFVARVVDAMTDGDFETRLAEQYHSKATALEFIGSCGSLTAAVSSLLGEAGNGWARRGDVVLIDGGEGDAVGVCIGGEVVAMGPEGVRVVPGSEIKAVWRI